ncbi:hypothetical protein FOVG_12953 [Fusarium oxysporum f. sp. pisi HDV247]|uniref:Uncharacterized protein n=1 Tax=Fusarium oxysporum f. sp. pisi HDV247 TaxID=1080344 RepID=W9P0X4_FUSOX|nr:hypothetical protein FOVG_12953 [Fusarium oxysporum f. sp. pisi HDV247]
MNMTSTPPATPKRQRNNAASESIAQNVLCGIEEKSREIRSHGYNVKRLATKLQNRARRALQDPRIDDDDLKDSWEAPLLLIKSKTAAASKDKIHKAQVWELQRRLNEQRTLTKKTRFNMHIGDWIHDIHNRVKGGEKDYQDDYCKEIQKQLTESGMPGNLARETANKYKEFAACKGLQISDTFARVQPEITAVKVWHSEGRTAEPPATPYLDRVAWLCARVKLNRKTYIDLIALCDERDRSAHHPPPHYGNYLDQNGNVKWSKVHDACDKRKRYYRKLRNKGKITQDQYALLRNVIKTWYKVYVSGWNADGTPILSEGVHKILKEYKKGLAKKMLSPPSIPDSPYTEGKWDDLL